MSEQLLRLPEKPGTVIAIGEWWLVRLRPYEGAPSAWELLPFPDGATRFNAEGIDVKAQCVYDDEWVLAEAEQEGGYLVIADPRDQPSGVQYFKPQPAIASEPRPERPIWDGASVPPPVGARVQLIKYPEVVGEVVREVTEVDRGYIAVKWDGGDHASIVRVGNLKPEARQ